MLTGNRIILCRKQFWDSAHTRGEVIGFRPQERNGTTMSVENREILDRLMELPALEKARLVDHLLSSLDEPDEAIDALWRKEVEDRIQAYQAGKLQSVSLADVLAKYGK
jgi:putative addiction module component (TIGR02574 family)